MSAIKKRKSVALEREEAIVLVNTCTLAVKHVPGDIPEDFGNQLQTVVNRIMRTFDLHLCPCCDLVKEGGER